ncbi:probable strigolactone esterase DAD2 [Cajanus cajan]|uniref:probable strigolactone esterase DAD2 n=1 Tax=Cajanus cajan TaxID=3821 RepID=UPI0010FB9417|nr:probable strigolactone esterase DAD2 [Cajanus cajan]
MMTPQKSLSAALNARIIGSGIETIVFCHGFGADQSIWDKIIPLLAENYSLVLFDWPFSGTVTDKNLYDHAKYTSFKPYADDLITIIGEMVLKCVTFVGHSMSAMIGSFASTKKPELFKRLILKTVVDVATIISNEIHQAILSTPSPTGVSKPLGFPGLIMGLCQAASS